MGVIVWFVHFDCQHLSTTYTYFFVSTDAGYSAESSKGPLAEEDHEIAAKVTLLNHKISSNISAMPSALKRMNDCNSMMEKLDTYNVNIHPAFKRKRTR
ncbi:hypothetical protein IFM89_037721 [Coptis chinensis]|uniref:Uncharacterized protein n=1 Tax=Coptis chinensis TaxID=261450 RepID=A0A835IJE1_9MAGN|nr:hypothetical protein IFM89_037721 [Coptis chinensis]